MPKPTFIKTLDMYAGAGGSSLGAKAAGAEIFFALNHWPRAIETHARNFPQTRHILCDIWNQNPRMFGKLTLLLASPECTNHSLAKGRKRKGQQQPDLFPADGDPLPLEAEERSRSSMWCPVRFAEYTDPEIVIIENVVDVRYWKMWEAWLLAWKNLGYEGRVLYLNSMHFHPCPQSRDRIYCVFWKQGNRPPDLDFHPTAYCQRCEMDVASIQSWKNLNRPWGKYGPRRQYTFNCPQCSSVVEPYYHCAANIIDWSLPAQKIGDRKKELSPKTVERIQTGLERFGGSHFHTVNSGRQGIFGLDEGLRTQTGTNRCALLQPPFVMETSHGGAEGRVQELTQALTTQTARQDKALVVPPTLVGIHNRHLCLRDAATEPLHTVVGGGNHTFLLQPPQAWIVDYKNNPVRPATHALSTVTAHTIQHYLMTYNGTRGLLKSMDQPAQTVTGVDRHALVGVGEGIDYRECRFRMLEAHEVQRAMAFTDDYEITGTKKEKVKQSGNAVTPPVMQALVSRAIQSLQ